MPTVLTSSQQTFVDITDQRKLSAYITSNLPKTQSEDPNVLPHTYAPSWASTNLVLTPVVFLDQTSIPLGSSGLTIQWKRKDGTAAETALTSGESVSGGILTVNQNKLASSSSGMITYICYISYYDSETHNTVNISADLTYTLVRNATFPPISPIRWCGTRKTQSWRISRQTPMCSSMTLTPLSSVRLRRP